MKTHFTLKQLNGDIYYNKKLNNYPIIIISHGFRGWKNWGFIPFLAQNLTKKNALSITFNYSHNGKPDNTGFIQDINNFANNSISQQIKDLNLLIKSIKNNDLNIPQNIFDKWNKNIHLIGHSLGAAISLIVGSKSKSVNTIILLATIATFDRYTPRQKQLWEKQGYLEFPNQTTNQKLRLNLKFLKDLEKNKSKFDLTKIINQTKKPVLIIHGKQDHTVPLKEITPLINSKNKLIKTLILPQTGHTFGTNHPSKNTSKEIKKVINIISKFLNIQ